jgi:hypothetical protein
MFGCGCWAENDSKGNVGVGVSTSGTVCTSYFAVGMCNIQEWLRNLCFLNLKRALVMLTEWTLSGRLHALEVYFAVA